MNLLNAVKTVAEFQRLFVIVSDTEAGAERRWQALQQWLADHPKYQTALYNCLKLEPEAALAHLCEQLGINLEELKPLDPQGRILAQAKSAVEKFQVLYKERAGMTATGGNLNG